jgi:hypothetical protein
LDDPSWFGTRRPAERAGYLWPDGMMRDDPSWLNSRHEVFAAAHRAAGWTLHSLWIDYLKLGGMLTAFDLDAFLAGLMPMPTQEQDVLACALNERLWDLGEALRVPYLTVWSDYR